MSPHSDFIQLNLIFRQDTSQSVISFNLKLLFLVNLMVLSFCHIFIFNKNLHYDYFGHVEKKVVIKVNDD